MLTTMSSQIAAQKVSGTAVPTGGDDEVDRVVASKKNNILKECFPGVQLSKLSLVEWHGEVSRVIDPLFARAYGEKGG